MVIKPIMMDCDRVYFDRSVDRFGIYRILVYRKEIDLKMIGTNCYLPSTKCRWRFTLYWWKIHWAHQCFTRLMPILNGFNSVNKKSKFEGYFFRLTKPENSTNDCSLVGSRFSNCSKQNKTQQSLIWKAHWWTRNRPSKSEVVCRLCSSGSRQRTSSRSIRRIVGNLGWYNCFFTVANLYLGGWTLERPTCDQYSTSLFEKNFTEKNSSLWDDDLVLQDVENHSNLLSMDHY